MTLERLSELFEEAIQFDDPQQQSAFIAASPLDADLRARLTDLVAAHHQQCKILDSPDAITEIAQNLEASDTRPKEGDIIRNYRLLQEIGEGGMGYVFMADQLQPIQRRVALKIIKTDTRSRYILARFEAEREALSRLDHPNITRIIDAGVTEDGHPFFVMELVRGDSLIEYCDRYKLTIQQRVELLEKVCLAVHHAHQKGIIHRDLKPSNIMVTIHDGVAVPKVIDFGIAKALDQPLTDRTLFTRYGDVVGTPQYMSPEQAEKSGFDLDLRTDVYSLGVVLYELLTGTTPIEERNLQGKGVLGILETIRDYDTESPSTRVTHTICLDQNIATRRNTSDHLLMRSLRGELDWITLKSLAKDRNKRYDSAASMAADLRSYLNGEPVKAAAPTFLYLAGKIYRRHRAICLLIATTAALLIVATGVSMQWAVSNARLKTLATKTADELLIQSRNLESLNKELKVARDRAQLAEAQALSLANEKKIQAATDRANSRFVLKRAGIVIGEHVLKPEKNLDVHALTNFFNNIFDQSPQNLNDVSGKPVQAVSVFPPVTNQVHIVGPGIEISTTQILDPDQIRDIGPFLAHSQQEQEDYYEMLVEEFRREFGNHSIQVTERLVEAGKASLKYSNLNWTQLESRAREALANLQQIPEQSPPLTELQAKCLLYRALVGQKRDYESKALLEDINSTIAASDTRLQDADKQHLSALLTTK